MLNNDPTFSAVPSKNRSRRIGRRPTGFARRNSHDGGRWRHPIRSNIGTENHERRASDLHHRYQFRDDGRRFVESVSTAPADRSWPDINAAGTGIDIRSRLSGGDFSIGENGGSTATQLGRAKLRPWHALGFLLNHGLGVHTVAQQNGTGSDFGIQLEDGTLLHITLGSQTTIGDVVDLINNVPAMAGNWWSVWPPAATASNWPRPPPAAPRSRRFKKQQPGRARPGINSSGPNHHAPAVSGGGVETIIGSDVNPGWNPTPRSTPWCGCELLASRRSTRHQPGCQLDRRFRQTGQFRPRGSCAREQTLDSLQTKLS